MNTQLRTEISPICNLSLVVQKHNENRNVLVSLHRGGTACNGCAVGHSRVLRDGGNQGVVGRDKHEAALGHFVD